MLSHRVWRGRDYPEKGSWGVTDPEEESQFSATVRPNLGGGNLSDHVGTPTEGLQVVAIKARKA